MNADEEAYFKAFNGKYVEITWMESREQQSACGTVVAVDDGDIILDWGYGVAIDAPKLMIREAKEQ